MNNTSRFYSIADDVKSSQLEVLNFLHNTTTKRTDLLHRYHITRHLFGFFFYCFNFILLFAWTRTFALCTRTFFFSIFFFLFSANVCFRRNPV